MLTVQEMKAMTDDQIRSLPRREWVTVSTEEYLDGTIEFREGRPLLPRLRMKTEYRAVPRKGRPMSCPTLADAKRWIDEQEIGGNPNGFIRDMQNRRRWR